MMMCWPSTSGVVSVIEYAPPVAIAVPSSVVPSKMLTVAPVSAVPVKVGNVTLVMLSLLETPVSLAGSNDGVPTAGACVSTTALNATETALVFPAASVAVAV